MMTILADVTSAGGVLPTVDAVLQPVRMSLSVFSSTVGSAIRKLDAFSIATEIGAVDAETLL